MKLTREEKATLVILCTCALAVAALFIFSGDARDSLPPYTQDSDPGDNVRVDGILLHKEKTGTGNHFILLVKTGADMAKVFVPASSDSYAMIEKAADGDSIRLSGVVKLYNGETEVVVN